MGYPPDSLTMQGLRLVGNITSNDATQNARKGREEYWSGDPNLASNLMAKAGEQKRIAEQINGAIGGIKRPSHIRRSLEFIGSDGTHEFFARSVPDEEVILARDIEEDNLTLLKLGVHGYLDDKSLHHIARHCQKLILCYFYYTSKITECGIKDFIEELEFLEWIRLDYPFPIQSDTDKWLQRRGVTLSSRADFR